MYHGVLLSMISAMINSHLLNHAVGKLCLLSGPYMVGQHAFDAIFMTFFLNDNKLYNNACII